MKYFASAFFSVVLIWTMVVLGTGGSRAAEPRNHALTRTEPSKTAPFKIDPAKEFFIDLGRGSGMDGLATIAITSDGQVTLHRLKDIQNGQWQNAKTTFDRAAIDRLLAAIESNKLMEMAAQYHADVHDGTQWILWIRQGQSSKAIYFNNHFPEGIRKFAKAVDEEIKRAAIAEDKWQDDPQPRSHEKAIWESIK